MTASTSSACCSSVGTWNRVRQTEPTALKNYRSAQAGDSLEVPVDMRIRPTQVEMLDDLQVDYQTHRSIADNLVSELGAVRGPRTVSAPDPLSECTCDPQMAEPGAGIDCPSSTFRGPLARLLMSYSSGNSNDGDRPSRAARRKGFGLVSLADLPT